MRKPGFYNLLFWVLVCLLLATGLSSASANAPRLRLHAPSHPLPVGSAIDIELTVEQAMLLGNFEAELYYDPALLQLTGFTLRESLGHTGACQSGQERCAAPLGPAGMPGSMRLGGFSYGAGKSTCGDCSLATLHFRSTGRPGKTILSLKHPLLTDTFAQPSVPQGDSVILNFQQINLLYLPAVLH